MYVPFTLTPPPSGFRVLIVGYFFPRLQPDAASINGEVDLLTYWYTSGMQEAILR